MTIGMIYGCWDMFHVGHLKALLKASEQCNYLFVGVFTDDVIKKYKGRLPIINLDDRLLIVNRLQLNCKHLSLAVHERRPQSFHFQKLFISETLRDKPLHMVDEYYKGEIIYIPRTMGISTSKIEKECYNRCKDEI